MQLYVNRASQSSKVNISLVHHPFVDVDGPADVDVPADVEGPDLTLFRSVSLVFPPELYSTGCIPFRGGASTKVDQVDLLQGTLVRLD